jgi:MoxR-like ATPase
MADTKALVAEIEALGARLGEAKASINRRFIGQEKVVDLVLASDAVRWACAAGGPAGLGKTRLVDTLAR